MTPQEAADYMSEWNDLKLCHIMVAYNNVTDAEIVESLNFIHKNTEKRYLIAEKYKLRFSPSNQLAIRGELSIGEFMLWDEGTQQFRYNTSRN
jgi:hypothetical protein